MAQNHLHLTEADISLLRELRHKRAAERSAARQGSSAGQRVADGVTSLVGSWKFIIGQSVILAVWIALNIAGYIGRWDPYPFILLNLVLSFQAAYTAPIIMMSQNRQAEIDRQHAANDYRVNVKAELEIELLHQKIDLLREKHLEELLALVKQLEARRA